MSTEPQTNILKSNFVSQKSIQEFISALREELRGDEKDNNLFRFITEKNDDGKSIEKSKSYLAKLGIVTLVALKRVVDKYYTVNETWQEVWEDFEPASEIEITTDYEKYLTCFEHGVIELTNKKTGNRLTLYINTETSPSYYKIYSIEGNKECKLFIKRVNKSIKENNLYKNKTFSLEKSYSVGLIPKFLKSSTTTKGDIIISSEVADVLQANVIDIFEREEEYRAAKIPLKRGVILEGPPGNGKTTIIKYIETHLAGKVTIIYVTDGAIGGPADISEIYNLARNFSPSIVVLEDIDTIGLTRERGSNSFTSELLGQLDGLEALEGVVTIATTNHADLIDDALKNRPSRFDRRLKIPMPNEDARMKMLTRFLKEKDICLTEEEINTLSKNATKDFSGAMLKEAVITSKMLMIQNKLKIITQNTLIQAFDVIRKTFYDSKVSNLNVNVGFRN
jgi:SpoVK/Ycf46/Vps4 family AAA+-type ATPase